MTTAETVDTTIPSEILSDPMEARRFLAAVVERALHLLDELEGDPDLEDGDEDDQCEDEGHDSDREWDQADDGIADKDALNNEDTFFGEWPGDGSGHEIARGMLDRLRHLRTRGVPKLKVIEGGSPFR